MWNGKYRINKARAPAGSRAKDNTSKGSTKRSSTSGKTIRTTSYRGGSYVANPSLGITEVYTIDVTVGVVKGEDAPSLIRRTKVSCQQRRKSLRNRIKGLTGYDIGRPASSTRKLAPKMYSDGSTKLRKPTVRKPSVRSMDYRYPPSGYYYPPPYYGRLPNSPPPYNPYFMPSYRNPTAPPLSSANSKKTSLSSNTNK